MYNYRNNSKTKPKTSNTILYSAALQDHILKKGNYQIQSLVSKNTIGSNRILPSINNKNKALLEQRADKEIRLLSQKEKRSILPYQSQALKKLKQVKSDGQKMEKYNKKLTWAQKLGIVEKPPLPLTANDWIAIEEKSKKRNDLQAICSICLEDFKIQPQVILSCSHVFHHQCLASFEKHNKVHCCPICRKQNYQKKVIDAAIRAFTMKSIIRVQRVFRGSRDRIRIYQQLISQNYQATSKLFNRRLIGYKMWRLSTKIKDKMKRDHQSIDRMMSELQEKHRKETDEILSEMVEVQRLKMINQGAVQDYLRQLGIEKGKPGTSCSKHDWEQIIKKSGERKEDQCSICLMALWAKNKPVYLLSCTHSFHVNCIEGFQRYALPGCSNKCPCCRSEYDKKVVERKN